MATPAEKLAESLAELQKLQNDRGIAIIKAQDLSRTHKERLTDNGFIFEVIKGWYISRRPDEKVGDTTSWYVSFWNFIASYIDSRFDKEWCLSPEQSLSLHSGNTTVPKQLLIRSPKASNNRINLIHGCSVFDSKVEIPSVNDRIEIGGIQAYSLISGLIAVSTNFFIRHPIDARTCLAMVKDSSEVLSKLLDGGKSVVAGRLTGAFRNIGKDKLADDIINTMKSAGYDIREDDPFQTKLHAILNSRETSPYANRIRLMWQSMRQLVIDNFPKGMEPAEDKAEYLKQVDEIYATLELIDQVRGGSWNPDRNKADRDQRDAMAARGYYQAFQKVKESIKAVLNGKNSGEVANDDHGTWYRELFAPSVTAGILKPADLAGYRNDQVYIRGSMHTPLNPGAVRDVMPILFDLLKEEKEPSVRVILGHFMFVYIHPYMDGNGRIARFLMNVMLASGGYRWAVIPVEKRFEYMAALEKASVKQDISDFTRFIAGLVKIDNPTI
jgi:hypothetical protein